MENIWEMWKWEKMGSLGENTRTSLGTCDSLLDIQDRCPKFSMSSTLTTDCSYMLFRKGQRPEWDDKMNGGRWATYGELGLVGKGTINHQWLKMLEVILSTNFGNYSDEVCGCQIDIRRKNYRIALWTFDKDNTEACTQIGRVVQEAVSPTNRWKYEDHKANHYYKASYMVQARDTLKPLTESNAH